MHKLYARGEREITRGKRRAERKRREEIARGVPRRWREERERERVSCVCRIADALTVPRACVTSPCNPRAPLDRDRTPLSPASLPFSPAGLYVMSKCCEIIARKSEPPLAAHVFCCVLQRLLIFFDIDCVSSTTDLVLIRISLVEKRHILFVG
ncbi:hypothetical protein PUN28_016650 [Cardiocondyla obscurior]|uniref:Uncharacterized protein n=1 Tax=Cardiocondyla obscurior TaxID=286306 RepID=A0AAW2ETG7_9HYME